MCIRLQLLAIILLVACTRPAAAQTMAVNHALVSGDRIALFGSGGVHWGTVVSSGSIELTDLFPLNAATQTLRARAGHFTCAGVASEYWVHWRSGETLYERRGAQTTPIFPASLAGIAVTDFFSQLANGEFTPGWDETTFTLTGDWNNPRVLGNVNPATGKPVLVGEPAGGVYPVGLGALVQNSPAVKTEVADILTTSYDYGVWRQAAIDSGYYLRPKAGGGYLNETSQTLYLTGAGVLTTQQTSGTTALTSLGQLSMKSLVPPGGDITAVPAWILFVDTYDGTSTGTQAAVTITLSNEFFWKGLLYIAGSLTTSTGGSSPTVLGRSPDQTNHLISSCILNGVLVVDGSYSRTGNASLYGSMIAKRGIANYPPEIFFDSTLASGMELGPAPVPVTLSRISAE